MTIIWYMVPEISTATDTIFLSSWAISCPNSPKNEISKKWKKHLEIIILHNCTKNYDYRLYCSWNMVFDKCNYFPFWPFFCPFTPPPPNSPKKKISKKLKTTPGDVIVLHKWTKNHDYMLYCSWDMAYDLCNCCFQFWAIFCPFTPLTAQKMNIS